MSKKWIIVLVSILFFYSCSTMNVTTNYDEQADFKQFKTFSFAPPKDQSDRPSAVHNRLFTKEMLQEIRPIMERKGFQEAAAREDADLLVVFYAMIKNKRDFVPPSYRVGRWGRVWATRPGHVVRYQEGTLVIDVVDQKKQDLVWQGVGKGVLDRSDPAANLVGGVEKVLEKFPPVK